MSQRNPGFTAEASLYQTVQPYYMLASSPSAGAILQPAQAPPFQAPPVANGFPWRCFSFCYCRPDCRRVCEIVCRPPLSWPIGTATERLSYRGYRKNA